MLEALVTKYAMIDASIVEIYVSQHKNDETVFAKMGKMDKAVLAQMETFLWAEEQDEDDSDSDSDWFDLFLVFHILDPRPREKNTDKIM